ncbi:MAG TPA: hypothetical protein DIC57_11750 [Sphaerochaeta sp.]|nr:hypothetical protein [Sphaerochaeta sp.]
MRSPPIVLIQKGLQGFSIQTCFLIEIGKRTQGIGNGLDPILLYGYTVLQRFQYHGIGLTYGNLGK